MMRALLRHRLVRMGLLVAGGAFALVVAGAGAAFAYWLASSTPTGNPAVAAAAVLSAPTAATATANGSGQVTVGWTLPATQLTGAQYVVTQTSGSASPVAVCTVASTVNSCSKTGLVAGTTYGYSIAATLGSWTSAPATASTTTSTPTFSISLSASSTAAGAPLTVSSITAKVGGSVDTTYAGTKTINWSGLGPSPSGATPAYPSLTVTFTSGVANPGTVTDYLAGSGQTLTATDSSAPIVTGSTTFTVNPTGAALLAFTQQPAGAAGGTAFTTQPKVAVEDTYGNVVTTDASTVTLVVKTGTGSGTLSACSQSETSGVVTFSGCSINTAGTGYQLHATDGTLTPADSSAFTVSAGAAAKLVFTTQPVGGVGEGAAFNTQPIVSVEDANGNVVTSDTGQVTLAKASGPAGGTLACTNTGGLTVTAVNGVATFAGCNITGTAAAGSYTLTAARSGLATGTSNSVSINYGSATKLVFTTQPVGGVGEGAAFGTQPVVSVEDANGNVVTSDSGTVGLAASGGSGTLACTNTGGLTVTAVNGVATFSGCTITGTAGAGNYTLSATRSGLTTATSSSLTVNVGPASQLAFTTQPVGGVGEGVAFGTQPIVSVEDAYRNVVISDNGSVTLGVASGPAGGVLACANTGNLTATAANGVATFAGCNITGTAAAGSYTLSAARSGLTGTTSNSLTINFGTASRLVFTTQPVGGVGEGTAFATQPIVSVEDANSNVVTSDTGTVGLSASGGSGTLACTNTGGLNATAVAGVATFAGCNITGTGAAGSYTLTAARSGLATGTSNSVTINYGSATKLVFTTQPVGGVGEGAAFGTQPVVSVEDANGNVVTSDSGTVTLGVASGPSGGTLACTNTVNLTATAVNGVATFAGCNITGTAAAGSYTLSATRSGLTGATSNSLTINPGSATKLVFTQQPSTSTGGTAFATQPKLTVEDANGNAVTSDASTVALSITSGTPTSGGPGTLSGCSETETLGVVTFTGCSINTTGTAYKLHATDGGLAATDSMAFNVTVGAAAQLVFSQQPVGGVAETVAFATQPKVTVEDAGGNVVTTDSGSVSLALASGPSSGTLACTNTGGLTATASAGIATFSGCNISGTAAAGTYTLSASRTGLTSPTPSAVVVNASAAAGLTFTSVTALSGGTSSATTVSCTGIVGSSNFACTPATQPASGNTRSMTGYVSLIDQYQNVVTNPGTAISVSLTQTNGSGVSPATVAIAAGASTSGQFTESLPNGSNQGTVTASATVSSTTVYAKITS